MREERVRKKNMKKIKKQVSFYAKMNEIKNVYFSDMLMILIVYKKKFNTKNLIIVFLVFMFLYCMIMRIFSLIRLLVGCHILGELNIKLILYLKKQYLTNQSIEVILTR
jgi:hypothetical protein